MRITPELLRRSPIFLNAVKEREIDLRNNHIVVIENLGATEDLNQCINLCDNLIVKLENFPVLKRLQTQLLANNNIKDISVGQGTKLPNLESLIQSNNNLTTLEDIKPLQEFENSIRILAIDGNPITKKYTNLPIILSIILPKLQIQNYQRINKKDHEYAKIIRKQIKEGSITWEIFCSIYQTNMVDTKNIPTIDKDVISTIDDDSTYETIPKYLTPQQRQKFLSYIDTLHSTNEVTIMDELLKKGLIPKGVLN